MRSLNFHSGSDEISIKIKIIIGFVVFGLAILTIAQIGVLGSYLQFQEQPLDTLKYGIIGVAYAFRYQNFFGIVLGVLLGWFIFGSFYVDKAREYNRNLTWAFFLGVFFGLIAGIFYLPYLWIVGKKRKSE